MSGLRPLFGLVLLTLWACEAPPEITAIGVNLPPPPLRATTPRDMGPPPAPRPLGLDGGVGPTLPWPIEDQQPHPLAQTPLPPAWSDREFAVASVDFARRVVGDDAVVGLGVLAEGALLAVTATGGLFSDWSLDGWTPLATPLPPLARAHIDGDMVLACPRDRRPARLSLDGGQRWAQLDLGCGEGGRVTLDAGRIIWLHAQQLEVWDVYTGLRRTMTLPMEMPRSVGVDGERVVVFGEHGALWSGDGGQTFSPAQVPDDLIRVRQVIGAPKHVMFAVGESRHGGSPLLLSRDDGRHWSAPGDLPRGVRELWAGAVDGHRVFVASPKNPGGAVIRSEDAGRTWREVISSRPLFGAVAHRPHGNLVGVRGGLARAVDGPPVRPLALDQPLRAVRFTHPLIGIGIGASAGVYCTVDGGVRWTLCSPELQMPFSVLDKADEHTYFVGGAGVFRRTRDAGRTWNTVVLATPCRPRWVRFYGAAGMMACGQEDYLLTDDAGRTWTQVAEAPAAMATPTWLDAQRLVTSSGRMLRYSDDGGWSWRSIESPHPDLVELRRAEGGLSAVTSDGAVGTASDPEGPWAWRFPSEMARPLSSVVAHRPLLDGRVVLLDRTQVYLWDGGSTITPLGPAPEARDLALLGDGSILVLQGAATTRFEGR